MSDGASGYSLKAHCSHCGQCGTVDDGSLVCGRCGERHEMTESERAQRDFDTALLRARDRWLARRSASQR